MSPTPRPAIRRQQPRRRILALVLITSLLHVIHTPLWAASGGDDIEDAVEDSIEADIEDAVEDSIEADIEDAVEDSIEADIEDAVEDSIEADIEDAVENDVEDEIEDEIEDNVEDTLEDDASAEAEDRAADALKDLEDTLEQQSKAAEKAAKDTAEAADDADDNSGAPADSDDRKTSSGSSTSGSAKPAATRPPSRAADQAQSTLQIAVDEQGNRYREGEWLILAEPGEIRLLEQRGYVVTATEPLAGMDLTMVRMIAPANFDLQQTRQAIRRLAPGAGVDVDHLYELQQQKAATHPAPGIAHPAPAPADPRLSPHTVGRPPLTLGMIDSAVDRHHPALQQVPLHTYHLSGEQAASSRHGTAVASILVGQDAAFRGLLPGAELYAAAVFFNDAQGRETTSTAQLARALNWLLEKRADVVNMSLAGPDNDILRLAIERCVAQGMRIVAAAGNRGPGAAPLYPAGYDGVIAVTAVDANRRVYRLASRGNHLDFAAPGVDIRHAEAGGGYSTSSGTSMAAPVVTATLAATCRQATANTCVDNLRQQAQDLGQPGFDPVYGFGLITPPAPH